MSLSRRAFVIGATALGLGGAHGMYFSRGIDQRTSDMRLRSNSPVQDDVWDLSGRTLRDISDITGRVVNYVTLGQSINQNSLDGFSTVEHGTNIFNLSLGHPMKKKIFQAQEPLLVSNNGLATLGHHGMPLADQIIDNDICDNVIITNVAVGGSYCADWCPGGGTVGGLNGAGPRTGSLAYRIRLAAAVIQYAGLWNVPTILDWQCGIWDSDPTGTTEVNYTNALNGVIAELRKVGLLRPGNIMFVHKETNLTSNSSDRNPVRAAQAAVVDDDLVLAGADIDTLGSEYRVDDIHFSVAGGIVQATLKRTVIDPWIETLNL